MKNLKMPRGRITDPVQAKHLFFLCWIAYVFTYLGRLNYSACLVEIVSTEGWSKSQAGLIATGFFTTYGLGQLVNGWIGDKLPPKVMVACGLGCSGLVNFLFPFMGSAAPVLVLWCINGFVQSMIWAPLIRQLSEWLPAEHRLRACVNMNSTVPVGTLAVYGISAGLVFLGNWRIVFFFSGFMLIAMSFIWYRSISAFEKKLVPAEADAEAATDAAAFGQHTSMWKLALMSAMPLILLGLCMQGMLKDGVTTWIPTFLEENFGLTAAASILCTTVVPIVNLGGVYFASWFNRRFTKNEVLTAAVFFSVALAALILLGLDLVHSALFSLLLLTVTTTFMMGVNTLLASMIPSYYVRFGVCSTVTGLLNSFAYIGCAVSSYGNGAVIEHFGWGVIHYCWCFAALIGMLVCFLAARKWKRFRHLSPANDL